MRLFSCAASPSDGDVRNPAIGQQQAKLKSHTVLVNGAAVLPDGQHIVTAQTGT